MCRESDMTINCSKMPMHNRRDRLQDVSREVSFDPLVKIRSVPSLDEYEASEHSSIWYKRSDFAFMRLQNKNMLTLMVRNELEGSASEYCSRGLERYMDKEEHRESRQKRHTVLSTVILEQTWQWSRKMCNPQTISNHSMKESKECVFAAHKQGLEDEREAMFIHATPTSDQTSKAVYSNGKDSITVAW